MNLSVDVCPRGMNLHGAIQMYILQVLRFHFSSSAFLRNTVSIDFRNYSHSKMYSHILLIFLRRKLNFKYYTISEYSGFTGLTYVILILLVFCLKGSLPEAVNVETSRFFFFEMDFPI